MSLGIIVDEISIVLFFSLMMLFLLFLLPSYRIIKSTKKQEREMKYDESLGMLKEDEYII